MDDFAFDLDVAIPEMGDAPESGMGDTPVLFDERAGADVPPGEPPAGTCIAFQGVHGGAGVTSLAVQTAYAFAQAKRGNVCLVDLDFAFGAVAHYLDIGIVPEVADFQVGPSRMDRNYFRALLSDHEAGFSVLGSPAAAGGNDAVDPATVLQMLDLVTEMFPVVVLDVPRLHRPWVEAAMLAVDRACLVTELTIPALHAARLRLDALNARAGHATDVVLSKYERRSFKASIRRPDAERALGQDVTGVIGWDPQSPLEGMNCGEPAGRIHADSRYTKDVGALVRTLSPQLAERRKRRSPLGRLARK